MPLWCQILCVIIGSVVFVAGAFFVQGEGAGKFYGLNTTCKVEISVVTPQGLNLNAHLPGTSFAPVTEMTDMIFNKLSTYRRAVV